MALNIQEHEFKSTKRMGYYYDPSPTDDPAEVLTFLESFTGDKIGWIQTSWGTASIKSHPDGKGAVFINGSFDKGDVQYYNKLIGLGPTQLLLRHHTIR